MSHNNVNIFWDNSNIFIEGKKVCQQKEPLDKAGFRISIDNLFDFAIDANRVLTFGFVGGSVPTYEEKLWKKFENRGIKVEKQERGAGHGKEVAVDMSIQFRMQRRMLEATAPETIVLLTGDGAGHKIGEGFIPILQIAVNRGWKIEVISWDRCCNRKLKEFAQQNGTYYSLEDVYEFVTFIEKKRRVKPLDSTIVGKHF